MLIGAESEDIRIAALVLLARLDDARLGPYADRIVAFASGPDSAVRRAARPLWRASRRRIQASLPASPGS
ncbi:hypothetical protein ACU4GA_24960 [Methylobacterium oryzae CBMB20]